MYVFMGGKVDEQGKPFQVTHLSRFSPTSIDVLAKELESPLACG